MDALDDLKAKLDIEAVVGADHELKGRGRYREAREHDSLKVDTLKQRWSWYSRGLTGDALAWFIYARFGRTEADGEDFLEAVGDACRFAGIDYESAFKGTRGRSRAKERRAREEVLGAYAALARGLLDKARMGEAKAIKGWITEETAERWGLGYSPSTALMKKAGLDSEQLEGVGLLRQSTRGDGLYAHFRQRLIVPFWNGGRVVYLGGRDLVPTGGAIENKNRKFIYLPGPPNGTPVPDGFNLDALRSAEAREIGVRLVEGPLDAIRTCEVGLPAVAMLSSSPSPGLVKRIERAS